VDVTDVANGFDLDTDVLDVNETQETFSLNMFMTATCTVDTEIQISAADVENILTASVDCVAPAGEGVIEGGQVSATATPNLLPCEGGTSVIKAEVVGLFGDILEDAEFRFETTAGLIVQTGPDTAKLTLGPNQVSATVTAKIFDPAEGAEEPKTADVVVSLKCNNAPALVVTASPNVLDCTGTSTITASVRDANGHVVEGRGYHFITNAGLLTVNPNNAETEEATATLQLRPGDGDATVIVSSGVLHGTIEDLNTNEGNFTTETALVTVKQNCLGTTTGLIKVNSSSKDVACGENVFIGLSVLDEDIQTVVDNTPLTLIASHGGFYGGVGEGGSQTLLAAAQVPTSHGEANTIYTAPTNYNGEVRITAASGDVYGFTKLKIFGCAPAAAATPTTGTGAAPCVPIGDGVCITPPNTGRSAITPPSTGSAGLK
jgi:hypothetical protein